MTLEEIRELIKVVTDTGIAEIEVQRGENRVRIRRSMAVQHPVEIAVPAAAVAASAPVVQASAAPAAATPVRPQDDGVVLVKAPIVGTFYEASAPGNPAFVRVGETVQPGKVVCIIESMKLMNEIECEVAGVVVSKLVENGQPVEYGEALFGIRPL